jgi:hypothetical protein
LAKAKIPVAPVKVLNISVEIVTVNNSVFGGMIDIPPISAYNRYPNEYGILEDIELLGEEVNDGLLGKKIIPIGFPS